MTNTLPTPADATLIVPGSIGAHALAWLASLRASGRAVSTLRGRTRALSELFAEVPAHTPAREVTTGHLLAFLIRVREQPGPTGRVRHVNGALQVEDCARMFWNWMVRQELLDTNALYTKPCVLYALDTPNRTVDSERHDQSTSTHQQPGAHGDVVRTAARCRPR